MNYGVILFHTTAMTMKAEKLLEREGFNIALVPTPRQFSSDCGIALRFNWSQRDNVRAVLEKASVETQGVYQLTQP